MRSLVRYLLKNHAFVLFVLLETLALVMVFNYNSFQKAKYLNSSSRLTGNVYNMFHSVTGYFGLAGVNEELAGENARLRTLLENHGGKIAGVDTMFVFAGETNTVFRFVPAMVISNSVNRPSNYITLNKGSKDGIKPDQGIISPKGIVGVVAQVSESYSMGLSLLNRRWSVSAKLQKSGYYGSLIWQENDYRYAGLTEIPLHVEIAKGDTVVTSGYSSIFPEGILVGTISNFSRPDGDNYYSIEVELAVDFKSLSYVEIIENQDKQEINELKNMLRDAPGID
ncbi:rod shape-determining protein MreC [Mariniphaga sediminis]|jgi:rod shape-determining protein MreC|uniref:Cell shape-determining protein MreC n=1 Tax=Mariniphaga sediminis TaxID=1628158 RepID=A0A399D3R0_9BACT|nr:rod shape-determining protein MreC [Mariniphaga sediminis]RIH66279.1 rod shape-determining protein MreC [Mariniphaga sediminis]